MNPVIEIVAAWLALDVVLVAAWHTAHVLVRSRTVPVGDFGPQDLGRPDLRAHDLRPQNARPQHPRVAFTPRARRVLAHTSA